MTDGPEASLPKRAMLWVENDVVNPLVERILRSPVHPLLSWRLALLEYEGRVSGNRITTPVIYGRLGTSVVATTDRHVTNWWKNFRGGHPATLWIDGQPVDLTGRAELDPAAITDAYTKLGYRSLAWRWATKGLGVQPTAPREEREAAAADVVLVVFD